MALSTKTIALAILCFVGFAAQATHDLPRPTDNNNPELPEWDDWVAELVTKSMNEWLNDWNYPTFTDAEYEQRLREMSGAIQYKLHPMVKEVIVARTEKYRSSTEQVLGLSEVYFPIFEEHLAKYNLPHQLKYLPVIESRLEPVARSYAGAVGLWQFIPSTGKIYNLQINSTIDERSDTYKASEAAARMLSELYNYYSDWALALAAYNCGAGRVNRAIKDAGSRDYWVVRNYLPTETQKYVPYFMAFAYVGEYYELHELNPMRYPESLRLTDTIVVHESRSLYQLAKDLDMSPDTLRRLNPGYLKGYVPANPGGSTIVLPSRVAAKLRGYEAELEQLIGSQSENPLRCVRRIRTTDDLAFLARAFRCTPRDILQWSGLPEGYQPQPGDLVAIRKFKPEADMYVEARRYVETISIASLRVVSLQGNQALTASVYGSGHVAAATIASSASTQSASATNSSSASNLPVLSSAATKAIDATPSTGIIQKMDEQVAGADALERSRERRLRGAMTSGTYNSGTDASAAASVSLAEVQAQAQALEEQQKREERLRQQEQEAKNKALLAAQIQDQAAGNVGVAAAQVPTAEQRTRERNLRAEPTETGKIVSIDNNKPEVAPNQETRGAYLYHEVKGRETIWDIRNLYPQMTVRDILELNQLRSETDIRPGMQLKIRP